jgi:hypothetical protein
MIVLMMGKDALALWAPTTMRSASIRRSTEGGKPEVVWVDFSSKSWYVARSAALAALGWAWLGKRKKKLKRKNYCNAKAVRGASFSPSLYIPRVLLVSPSFGDAGPPPAPFSSRAFLGKRPSHMASGRKSEASHNS